MTSGNKTWDAVYQEWQTDDGQIHAMRMGLLIRCKDCKHLTHTPHKWYCPINRKVVDRDEILLLGRNEIKGTRHYGKVL